MQVTILYYVCCNCLRGVFTWAYVSYSVLMSLSLAGLTCIMHSFTKILSLKLSSLLTYFAYFLFRRILMMPPLSFCDNKPPSDSWHKANATIKYLAMRHANLGTDWSSRTTFLWSLCCLGMGVTCYGCQVLNNLLGIFCLTSTRLSPAKKLSSSFFKYGVNSIFLEISSQTPWFTQVPHIKMSWIPNNHFGVF